MNLTLLRNPFIKTLLSSVVGLLATTIDSAVTHPSGGMADALSSNPSYAIIFTAGALLFHNFASALTQQPKAAATPVGGQAPVTTLKVV